jgi:hypothetical protein
MDNNSWNDLLAFESFDLVKRSVKRLTGREPNSEKTREITSNFVQGREYFTSANEAGITVRPLLLYYGVVALSRGLILALDPSKAEHRLKPSHGLEVKNWPEILKNKDFENLEIAVGEGTFSELLKVTENKNYLSHNTSGINYDALMTPPDQGYRFSFKGLIQYFPDLDKEYKVWLEKDLDYAVLESLKHSGENNEKLEVSVNKCCNDELIELLFPTKYCPDRIISRQAHKTTIIFTCNKWMPNLTQCWKFPLDIGDVCVVPVMRDDKGLNLLGGMYAIAYVLGMMARYYPTTWISLMRSEKGDKIYPFVHRILDYIYDKFPKQVLTFLNAPYEFE